MPKVSVIVPVYGAENYLDKCVNSLINQTLRDIEIILVDDKSPDRSPKICDDYALMDSRIIAVHKEKNEGAGYARNTGLTIARGEFISFIDSDDYVELDLYEHMYQECTTNDLDICYFKYRRVDNNGNIYNEDIDSKTYTFYSKDECFKIMLAMMGGDPAAKTTLKLFPSVCFGVFRTSTLKDSGVVFSSERCGEDFKFTINLLSHVNRIKVIPNVYYNYFVNTSSVTMNYSSTQLNEVIKLLFYTKTKLPADDIYTRGFYGFTLTNFKTILRFEVCQKISLIQRYKRIKEICNLEILKSLYSFPISKFHTIKDKLFVYCMKHKIVSFFILTYKLLYRKYNQK